METENPFAAWIGRTRTETDQVTPVPLKALVATVRDEMVLPSDGDPLPPLGHWLYFLPDSPMSQLGPDGHPKRGDFLPPITLARRLWAGGRLRFVGAAPRVGETITRTTEIRDIEEKTGQAGALVFVTLLHRISTPRGLAIEEEQDLVYVDIPDRFVPPPGQAAPTDPAWNEPWPVGPVLLFRFSALTFNGHRIHYDRCYATEFEKYPGLVVHGPLQAMALVDSACRHNPSREVAAYSYRAVRPLFDFDTVSIQGIARADGGHDVATVNGEDHVCMRATVHWA